MGGSPEARMICNLSYTCDTIKCTNAWSRFGPCLEDKGRLPEDTLLYISCLTPHTV